jgi:hypothetical protein
MRAVEFPAPSNIDFLGGGGGISSVPRCAGSACHFSLASRNLSEMRSLMCDRDMTVSPDTLGGFASQDICSLIAGVSFGPDQVNGPSPPGPLHGRHPPLDPDRMLLTWACPGVSSSGARGVRVDHQGLGHSAVVEEPVEGPFDRADLRVEGGLNRS